jgi:2-polyprenyl-3-methyl-5-hydroxy-6-metoxy-1,4-benzoquinol methylase
MPGFGLAGQGRHIDPDAPDAPPPPHPHPSATMEVFADCLRPPGGGSVREGVVDDLAAFYGLTQEQVVERCLDWEAESIKEWHASRRDSAVGLADFYDTVQSWSFDVLWYAYLQAAGYPYPASVVVADTIGTITGRPVTDGGRMLDFGSGAGVTGQFFSALGWDVTMADVSATLLEFARWRHERRGLDSKFLRLPADLPDGAFDLITAIDVFAQIPNAAETARQLHRALRPGGVLVTNFDVRPPSEANAWHLYEHAAPLRWAIERVGFAPVRLIDGFTWFYRAEPAGTPATRLRTALAWARLASPPSRMLRTAARGTLRTASRLGLTTPWAR